MADMLDLRGLPRDVNDEASLGGLKVVDDVLSELLAVSYTHLTLPTILRV